MKTMNLFSKYNISVIVFLLISCNRIQAQSLSNGTWEGYFMNDFRTVLKFSDSEEVKKGTVQMFSGEHMIQNDILSEIELVGNTFSFFIEAKETQFKGKFDADQTVLQGNFIFPDGTRHPFSAKKIPKTEKPRNSGKFLFSGGITILIPNRGGIATNHK